METKNLSPKQDLNSIKLIKGQRGGYGWEIIGEDELKQELIQRIKMVEKELTQTYIQLNKMEANQNGLG